MNNGSVIKIEQRQYYITEQTPVTTWEARLVYRVRQIIAAGTGEFIVRIRGDEVTIFRIGKPEVVKE